MERKWRQALQKTLNGHHDPSDYTKYEELRLMIIDALETHRELNRRSRTPAEDIKRADIHNFLSYAVDPISIDLALGGLVFEGLIIHQQQTDSYKLD